MDSKIHTAGSISGVSLTSSSPMGPGTQEVPFLLAVPLIWERDGGTQLLIILPQCRNSSTLESLPSKLLCLAFCKQPCAPAAQEGSWTNFRSPGLRDLWPTLLIWTPGQVVGPTDRRHEGCAASGVPAGEPGISTFGESCGNQEDCAGMALGGSYTALAFTNDLLVQVTGRACVEK